MRPLKLTLSAFGPYAKEEVIDFTKLNGKNIFLITGVTGAGKTTIFDAISYALFGEASGTSRETASLRSHFAKDNIYTYVELEFEVKGNLYYVKRSPEQEVAKLRGEGTTKKNSTVELILPKGDKPLTKVNEVNEKIREIIGVDKEQFRQIVMLPQGEFRQLLEAKSTIREEIFRKIFGTQAFLKMQKNLREKRNKLQDELKLNNSKREVYVKSLKAPDDNILNDLKEKSDIDITTIEELAKDVMLNDIEADKRLTLEIENLKENINSIEKNIALINENNNKILKKENAEKNLIQHKNREKEIEEKIYNLNKSKKALEVKTIDDNKFVLEKKLKIRLEELEKAIYKENLYKKEYDEAITNLNINNNNEKLRNSIKEELVILTPYEEKIKLYEEKNIIVLNQENYIKTLEVEKELCDKEINSLKEGIDQLIKKINNGVEAEGKYKALEIALENYKNTREILANLYKNYNKYFDKENKFKDKKQDTLKKEKEFKKCRIDYQDKEDLFRKAQAGILAENLKENMPCPVCGSTNHPNKSKKVLGVPTEEELKKLKVNLETKEEEYTNSLLDLKSLSTEKETLLKSSIETICNQNKNILGEDFFNIVQLKDQQKIIKEIGINKKNKIDITNNEIVDLKNILSNKAKSEKDKEAKEKRLKEKELLLKDLIEKITENKAILASERQVLTSIEIEIPENLRDLKILKERMNSLKLKLAQSEKELKLAQERLNKATTNYSSAKEFLNLSNKEKDHILNEYNNEKDKLEKSLKINEFENYEDFKKSCLDKNTIELLEDEISNYKENYKVLLAIWKECCDSAKGVEIINTIQLQEKSSNYKNKEKELNENLSKIKARISSNKENLKKIKEFNSDIKSKEDEFRVIAELESVAFGDKGNLKKITFESYVLTSYFDEIIQAANIRLEKMSSGRFELKRKEDLGKGNKKQGLDLEVIDYHTGKARDVRTLSGGEGFKASLSLALGLADIIQSYAGGISIDTMFVDEGFGTLDPASLDNAIECLLSLQQGGRLVGIISHVPELKERVEAILEVKSDKDGSNTEFIII